MASPMKFAVAWGGTASLGASPSCSPAINDQKQGLLANDAEAFGFAHSYPAEFSSLAGHLPVSVLTRAPGLLFDAIRLPADFVQHLPRQTVPQFLTGRRVVHQSCLSSKASSDGSTTIEKAFGDGRISFGGQQIVFPR